MTQEEAFAQAHRWFGKNIPGVMVGCHPSYQHGLTYHVGVRQHGEWIVVGRGDSYEKAFEDLVALCRVVIDASQEKKP